MLRELAPYVPLFQSLLWVLLLLLVLALFRQQVQDIVSAIRRRIETGSAFRAGPVELGEDLRDLPYVESGAGTGPSAPTSPAEWESQRVGVYQRNRGVFLAHVIEPSCRTGQKYDVFVFLVRHGDAGFADVTKVEFFFGRKWGNRVFPADLTHGLIGVATSAYGPFLCLCRVTFADGGLAELHRYIDFEMGRALPQPSN